MNDKLKKIQITERWQSLRLDEFFSFKYGSNLSTKLFSNSGYPVYGANGIIGYNNAFNYKECQVLISCRGENSGLINITIPKSFVTNNSIVCEPKFKLDKHFFFYLLKQIPKTSMVSGSAQPQVVIKDLSSISLFYPKSLPEQKKIAQILSTVDKAIEQTEQLIAKYQQIKTGLMQDLLTKGIDENGNIRSEETHEFKDSELGRIPKEWDCDRLDAFLSIKQYGVSIPLIERGFTPVLRMNNIKFGELFLNEIKYSGYPLQSQFILKNNDILFNRTNSIEHVGRTGIFREQNIEYSFASYLVRLVPNRKVNSEYLNIILNYKTTQDRIKSIATFAVHQANVNPTNLGNLYFVFPKINEQYEILKILNITNSKLIQERTQLQKLKSIKTALMQDLLSGKKRVNSIINGEL